MLLFLMICNSVLGLSGHIHVGIFPIFTSFFHTFFLHCCSLCIKEFSLLENQCGFFLFDVFWVFLFFFLFLFIFIFFLGLWIKQVCLRVSLRIFINYKLPFYIVCPNERLRRLHLLNICGRLIKLLLCNKHVMQMLLRS